MDGIGLYFIGKLGGMRYIVVPINNVMKLCINALTPVIQNIPRTDKCLDIFEFVEIIKHKTCIDTLISHSFCNLCFCNILKAIVIGHIKCGILRGVINELYIYQW